MINRDRFLVEGLIKYYELEIKKSSVDLEKVVRDAEKFIANNGGTVEAAWAAANGPTGAPGSENFLEYMSVGSRIDRMTQLQKGLSNVGALSEDFMEVALEDFRARTAVSTTFVDDNGLPREEVISRGQFVLENRDKEEGKEAKGESKAYDATTFKEKINLAEQYLTEKKGKQIGLFSGKSEFTSLDKFKEADIDELIKNLAVVDYQRELRIKEIPAENIRAAQMSTVKALSENTENLENFASRFFPFLEKRSSENLKEIFGDSLVDAIKKGQEALTNGELKDLAKKGVVSTEHLTGRLQPEFERVYNSLFGMNNLRDRNPDVVHPYGALSQILVNEAMTQIQKSPDGKVSADWIKAATSSVFPETFVKDAIEHAEENQKMLGQFLQVRETTPDEKTIISDPATRLAQFKERYPKIDQSADAFVDAVSGVLGANEDIKGLSDAEKLFMAQVVAREMTYKAPAGSAVKGINIYLSTALAQSTEKLRVEGKLPELGRLNDMALNAMLVSEKTTDGKIRTFPNEEILADIYNAIYANQEAETFPEDAKFGIPLIRPGQKEPFNAEDDVARAYEEERDGVVYKITPQTFSKEENLTSPENSGILSKTFGSHFFLHAAKESFDKRLEGRTYQKFDEKDGKAPQEPGVYGTYGEIVQDHVAEEKVKSDTKKAEIIKKGASPAYDGYKYKLITKTKYYQQKYNEYLQMYMATGGIAPFYEGIKHSSVQGAAEMYPVPDKVEEVVETQDPPVPPEPSPYDELGTKISSSFKILEKMHKRLVQRTVQGDGKDANRGLYLRNDQAGINAISSQSAMVRNYNSKVANTVLSNIQKVIEENPDRDPAEVVAELKGAMRFEKGKEVPVIPKGITISNDGQTVSFFGISYTREVNQDTNESTVYAHYNPDGERVPQSTLITIIAHDQDEVRDTVVNYMNVNKDVIEGREKPGQAPIIPDDTAVLNAFVQKDPTTGEYGLATGSDTLDRGPSGYDRGALDKADTSDMRRIDKACDNVEIIEAAVIDDPTA